MHYCGDEHYAMSVNADGKNWIAVEKSAGNYEEAVNNGLPAVESVMRMARATVRAPEGLDAVAVQRTAAEPGYTGAKVSADGLDIVSKAVLKFEGQVIDSAPVFADSGELAEQRAKLTAIRSIETGAPLADSARELAKANNKSWQDVMKPVREATVDKGR